MQEPSQIQGTNMTNYKQEYEICGGFDVDKIPDTPTSIESQIKNDQIHYTDEVMEIEEIKKIFQNVKIGDGQGNKPLVSDEEKAILDMIATLKK